MKIILLGLIIFVSHLAVFKNKSYLLIPFAKMDIFAIRILTVWGEKCITVFY